ncbi:unnamed protein product [Rhizoctonia solani]|uniref:F-box domain-containing protein n=1 Tax=Rhizoctonia solani TaxID=456999 RepID=A0A8H3C3P9_9AGAM|nr:unnamed protein product [Rhizoctonia solani]
MADERMHASSLPTEITLHISSYLPQSTLVNVSLVCRTWRLGILSILFSSIALTNDECIARFSRTITHGGKINSASPISQYIRSLIIASDSITKPITELGLAPLASCIPYLAQLARLHWRISFVPANGDVLGLFQSRCPQLKSVSLLVPDGHQFKNNLGESHYATLLGFKNLSEFKLQVHHIPPDLGTKAFGPLKGLVSHCPNLEFLQLYFLNPELRSACYTLDDVATWLGLEVFMPSLRRFHLLGSVQIDEASLVSSPDNGTHYFRNFLTRHAHLEELHLNCVSLASFSETADPEHLAQALPSLKRFSGPDVLCDLLVRSSVAKRLERLSIDECSFKAGISFVPHRPPRVLPLPMLRELVIGTNMFYPVLTILELLLPEAPSLERLGLVPIPPACHAMFLDLVSHTPRLQKTSIFNSTPAIIDPVGPNQQTAGDVAQHRLYVEMKKVCPELDVTRAWLAGVVLDKREAESRIY